MSLFGALSIATGGLGTVNFALGVVSQNVANASTPDYSVETPTQTDLTAGGVGMGVQTGPTSRQIDTQLQADLFAQDSTVSGLQLRQTALQQIDAVQGTPGDSSDLASLLGALQDAFSTLQTSPDSQTQQSQVVSAAQSLAQQVNALGASYTQGRQDAQNDIVTDVGTLNTTLATIGSLSDQIINLQASGQSTADLQNQRDQAMDALSQVIQVKFLAQPDGDMLVMTPSGLNLPIHTTTPPFATASATLAPGAYAGGAGVPPITLGGVDVTQQLQGGQLGAAITLRDQTLPTYQGELDEFAQTLSTRFSQQGLTLFTDPTGVVPTQSGSPTQAGYVGYASIMQVNPAVVAAPSLVRDGTQAVAGSATGASAFTPNPAGGPAGFTGMITRVLDYTFGADVQAGVAQPPPAITGLGPGGTLTAPYSQPTDLASFATAVVGAEADDSAQATAQITTEQAVQTSLQSKVSSTSAVSIDTEMSTVVQLENAYGANAKVITAVQTMLTALLAMVP